MLVNANTKPIQLVIRFANYWARLSESDTSGKNSMSVTFTKSTWKYGLIYVRASCVYKSLH